MTEQGNRIDADQGGCPQAVPPSFDAEAVYAAVWRSDFSQPGFFLLDLGPDVDSHTLRAWMVAIKKKLSAINVARTGKPFIVRSMGRFDQQETTKFHRDGAPDESLLVLGYEPSKVQSRLLLADHARCAFDLGIEPQQFLADHNPMFSGGEEMLARYITELPQPDEAHARILFVNNSNLPFTEARTNPLGVLHKAIIVNPTETERRLVNSAMLVTEGQDIGQQEQDEFVATDEISQKVY